MKIQLIVEGHGEVEAVPVLLRRLLAQAGVYDIEVGRPIRRHASDLNRKDRFQAAVQVAMQQEGCGGVLILFDYEDGCPKTKAAELATWAAEVSGSVPCSVVLAYREYETWFLAALESLRGQCGIGAQAETPADPETRRNAKGALEEWMPRERFYAETVDQVRLTHFFDLAAAYRRSRSFRRMVSAFGQQVRALGGALGEWPPTKWQVE
jgi:hypothetical protein